MPMLKNALKELEVPASEIADPNALAETKANAWVSNGNSREPMGKWRTSTGWNILTTLTMKTLERVSKKKK